MKKNYQKLALGIFLTILVIGGRFLFMEKAKQEKGLENLLKNEYSSFFEETPEDWKTYQNEKYGFEFKYPEKFMGERLDGPFENELEGTERAGLKKIYFTYFPYREKESSTLAFSITIFQGELTSEFFINHMRSFNSEVKEEKISWAREIIYFDKRNSIYEISIPLPQPSFLPFPLKEYFIPYKKENLVFRISSLHPDFDEATIPKELTVEAFQRLFYSRTIFEKIISTFKFLE